MKIHCPMPDVPSANRDLREDEPSFMIGPGADRDATIRHGASMLISLTLSATAVGAVLVRKERCSVVHDS